MSNSGGDTITDDADIEKKRRALCLICTVHLLPLLIKKDLQSNTRTWT